MLFTTWLFLANFVCLWFSADAGVVNENDLQNKGKLVSTHLMFRHGDRNPILQNPGDKYDVSYFPAGWGQLTNLGKKGQFELGQWLRRRYNGFLSNKFKVSDIYIQSSDVDRTIMSAECASAGLYPPQGEQIWNNNLDYQPTPIHVLPASLDYITGGSLPPCPYYERAFNKYMASYEVQRYNESAKPFADYIAKNTGAVISDPWSLLIFRDSWLVETIHNLKISEWAKSLYNDPKFYQAAMKPYSFASATKFLAKFRSGYILKDILDRFTNKINNALSPNYKFWIYSTHDSVLFSFLQSLDISDNDFVPYSATIILELRQYNNNYYVQIFYKNSDKTPAPIKVPGCGTTCLLSDLYRIYANILPKNPFTVECQIDE